MDGCQVVREIFSIQIKLWSGYKSRQVSTAVIQGQPRDISLLLANQKYADAVTEQTF